MADLVAADLTYTQQGVSKIEDGSGYRVSKFAISTAAGEYPTGGLPLDNNQLGCPNELVSLVFLEQDVADPLLTYHHDVSANTIVIMEDDGTSGVPAEHANATITTPDQLIVEAKGY